MANERTTLDAELAALVEWERGARHADFLQRSPERWIEAAREAARGRAPFALVALLVAAGLAVIALVFVVLFPPLAVFPLFGACLAGLVALIAGALASLARRRAAAPGTLERGALRIVDVRPRTTSGGGRLDLHYEIDARRSTGEMISLRSDAAGAAHVGVGQIGSAAWWREHGALPRLAEFDATS